jgi:hypothetical protein
MMMCQKDHKLAAVGTVSWPESMTEVLCLTRMSFVGAVN